MPDRPSWHECPEPDHSAEAREHRAAVGAGVACFEEVFFLVVPPPHRRVPSCGAAGHRLTLDERVTVGGEDRRRIVRRRAVRIPGPGTRYDEVRRNWSGKQDTALGVAPAPAAPGVAVLPH